MVAEGEGLGKRHGGGREESSSDLAQERGALPSAPIDKLKRLLPGEEGRGLLDDPDLLSYYTTKKMITCCNQLATTQAALGAYSTGCATTSAPSPLCSTPVAMFGQQPLMPLMQANTAYPSAIQQQMQLQAGVNGNSFEGMPIFVLPQNSMGITMAALQRVAELKAQSAASTEPKVDTSKHHHIFIGDLSPEVDAKMIKEAFSVYGEVSEAKVIRDAQTQKSRGYGFVSFPDRDHAEKALTAMNGSQLGRRAIRTNWATRRPSDEAKEKLTFEQVFNSTKADNTSVYVGNVCQNTTEAELREAFKDFGAINEVRVFKTQGYAFVRFDRKEHATKAIMEMNQKMVGGNAIRCSWGRTQNHNHAAMTPLIPDLSSLVASQQLLAPSPLASFAPSPIPSMPLWNPLVAAATTSAYQPFMNTMNPMAAAMLQQW